MRYTISLTMASLAGFAGMAMADVPRVVTDIPPVHSLVAQVMGDLGTPDLLLERGANEHSFQLRPSQAAGLNTADVVFWIGPELTPWLDRALESAPDTIAQVRLLQADGLIALNYAEGGHDDHASEGHDDHAAEAVAEDAHGHDHEAEDVAEDTDEHGHQDGSIDPHAWLSPANATLWIGVIAAELSRLDPENAATYAANAETAVANVAAADAAVLATLAPVAARPIVVFHEAFAYFAHTYGLTIAGTVAEGDAAAPGAARIAALRDLVAAGGAECLYPEVQHDPALMEQVVEGSAARIGGELDPVGSSFEPGPQMYAALLTSMANTIATCLTGG